MVLYQHLNFARIPKAKNIASSKRLSYETILFPTQPPQLSISFPWLGVNLPVRHAVADTSANESRKYGTKNRRKGKKEKTKKQKKHCFSCFSSWLALSLTSFGGF